MSRSTIVIASLLVLLGSRASLGQTPAKPKISAEERQALIALYNSMDGPHWKDKSGWLGPAGTECKWHGVTCNLPERIAGVNLHVVSIDLAENGLHGEISPEFAHLKKLEWLFIFGNDLAGILPKSLIRRWLAGALHISAESHLLTTVTKVEFEWSANALLCARRYVTLDSGGKATIYTTRCRNATPEDRSTYCEVKEGQIEQAEFARLAWTIENAGFFNLRPEYSRNVTHAAFENTRIIRDGKTSVVSNYANAGPLELWEIQRAIEGVASSVEPEKTSELPNCPRW